MRFWDTSAIVPLLLNEPSTASCFELLRDDPDIVVWCFTKIEALSALKRRERSASHDPSELRAAELRLAEAESRWTEVDDIAAIRGAAEKIIKIHELRAADSLQLGSAIVASDFRPPGFSFVCIDGGLCAAASREGFHVIAPAASKRRR